MRAWKKVDSRLVIDDRWMRLRADTCELPNGKSIAPYYVLEERDWVHVVALDERGQVLTVKQYRYAGNRVCVELPGGVTDDGELPLESAKRELLEETGYVAAVWHRVASVFANPARQTNRIHVFLARELTGSGKQLLDESEEISFAFASVADIKESIRKGDFSQSLHIASFYLALDAVQA